MPIIEIPKDLVPENSFLDQIPESTNRALCPLGCRS